MKTVFFAVDLQRDFMDNDGKLYVPNAELIRDNVYKIAEIISAYRRNIVQIITGDCHTPTSREIALEPDCKNTYPAHCLIGTGGMDFIQELCINGRLLRFYTWNDPHKIDSEYVECHLQRGVIIYKDKFDIFADNDIASRILHFINPSRVYVYGVVTNICVNYAVMGLLEKGFQVSVITDAIKELPEKEFDLDSWEVNGNKAELVKTSDIIQRSIETNGFID